MRRPHDLGEVSAVSISGSTAEVCVALEGLQDVPLAAGQRVAWRLGDHLKRASTPSLLTASAAVVAERGLYPLEATGTAMAMGIPLR